MNKLFTLLLVVLMPLASWGKTDAISATQAVKADTVDILYRFTYTWNNSERLDLNSDGSVTYHAVTWGGMAAWLVDNDVAADWSECEKVVFEFAAPTSVNTQILAGDAKAWGDIGITKLECYFDGYDVSAVQQIALQTAQNTTITVNRVYLVGKPVEEEEHGEGNPDLSQLVINEIMQSNIDCIMDDLNEYPDSWAELFNNSSETINLKDYSVGPTDKAGDAWQLPDREVQPGGFVLVYCDKVGEGMHADFRIDSNKDGAVYLFKDGQQIDKATPKKKQPAPNIAYGRITNGATTWGYMERPTPWGSNCGVTCTQILGEPVFSRTGVVTTNTQAFELELSLPDGCPEGTVIRYTTDNSEPTTSSAVYTSPIRISGNTVVRAKLTCEGYLSPRSTTHSYIFFYRDVTLPVISIVTDRSNLYDSKKGIYTSGSYNREKKNYEYNWRRPINIEMFEGGDQESVINQLCETRIQGGASRGAQIKSLVVYANKRFGTKRLDYEFFPDQRPGTTDYKSILLRNAGNDFDYLYMRDAIIQRTMAQNCDLDWQAWRPAIIIINGEYKGMLNIRERSTADNIYTNYDGLEDIDMLENWHEIKEGDDKSWNDFVSFYSEKGHTLDEYAGWIDWREFINLMVMNLFYNNQDFPGNNIVMWKPRAEGSVWRFVAKDTDFGLGLYGSWSGYNSIKWIYDPNYDSNRAWANTYEYTRLFRRMMDDEDFRREFIDHAAVYMGDFMNETGTRAVWDPMYEMIKYEYPNHRKLVNEWWPNYNDVLSTARTWIKNRPQHFYSHLSDYYGLGSPTDMTINVGMDDDDLAKVGIDFNGIRLTKGRFEGKFFRDRSITLSGTPIDGKQVTGWRIITVGSGSTTEETVTGSTYSFSMPSCTRLVVQAVIGDYDGIDEPALDGLKWMRDGDTIALSDLPDGTPVTIFNPQGMMTGRYIANGGKVSARVSRPGIYILKVGKESIKVSIGK